MLTTDCSVGLPSINHMDAERVKREEAEYQRKHSAPAMPSPLHPYTGPSHAHSNPQSSVPSTVPGSLGGLLSPPESRRMSGDDKDSQRAPARQSLPSIHEALGSEQPLSYPATVPPPSSITSAPQHYHSSSAAPSPAEQRPRNYPPDLQHPSQGPPSSLTHPRSPYIASSASQTGPPPPAPAPTDSLPRPPFSDPRPPYPNPQHNPKLPSLHPLKTAPASPPSAPHPSISYSSYPPPVS